ncbi:1-aminocyclopropane-1-carboxylate oxidase-like [Heracleum sosnowskyi]|uniref:1-aminocyclopropane-1-carboxylate oxidase-like n=1 Tax=Heracleum sosnowskyi TaxID=360622 RepID=A0AAD8I9U6_9APIA|nr:1-aminocyclopropane-1-carboxylate oxidase-like [Heracleum sosnowskyi]
MSIPSVLTAQPNSYDRLSELKRFDESKLGVKGLVDSGLTTIPRFFHHPPDTLPAPKPDRTTRPVYKIPIIDLSGDHAVAIEQVRRASTTLGFFQIINHGVALSKINGLISAIKAFNEQAAEIKMKYYHREISYGASFSSNFDLFQSRAASWRDTLVVRLSPILPDWKYVPEICRNEVAEWEREMIKVGDKLLGLLSEGLGLERSKLKEMTCLNGRTVVNHYYPYCPQADLTVGIASHTDPVVVTVLAQNDVGGLQVKVGEDDWVDVEPVPGALVINIGDILQIMSNDEYKSVEHRVLANPVQEPRISVVFFFNPGDRENIYGPIPEIVSSEKPPVYRNFSLTDFVTRFLTKELDGKSLINYYRL